MTSRCVITCHFMFYLFYLLEKFVCVWAKRKYMLPSVIIVPICPLWRQFDECIKKPFPDDLVSSQQSLPGGSSPVGRLLFIWDLGFEVRVTTITMNMLMARIMKDCNHQRAQLHTSSWIWPGRKPFCAARDLSLVALVENAKFLIKIKFRFWTYSKYSNL